MNIRTTLSAARCRTFLFGAAALMAAAPSHAAVRNADDTLRRIDYVRPLVGTDGYGNVYPGAQLPFGGIQLSPDTDRDFYDAAAGYKYNRPTLLGFSLNHLSGTGIPDLGDFLFMPGVGEIRLQPGTHEDPDSGYRSRYSHDREWCSPNYYAVDLLDSGVKAEMTAAQRSGMLRFTYPESDDAFILLDMDHTLWWKCEWSNLRLEDDHTLTGYKLVKGWGAERHVYLTAEFSVPIVDFGIMQGGKRVCYDTSRFRSDREAWGRDLKFWVRFATHEGEQVTVRVAISSVDPAGARGNLRETEGLSFDELRRRGDGRVLRHVVYFVVEEHLGRVKPGHRKVVGDVRQRVWTHHYVGLYAAAVAHFAPSGRVEHAREAVRHVLGVAAAGVAVVDGLYAAAAGYVVFARGELQLRVVRQVHRQLYEALTVGACAEDDGAVEVLQAARRYFAGAGRVAVNKDDHRHDGVNRVNRGGVVAVGAL